MPGKTGFRNLCRAVVRNALLLALFGMGFTGGHLAGARELAASIAPLVASGSTIVDEAIAYPSGAPAKVTAVIVTLDPGGETGWHTHGIPAFGYILDGELTVDYREKGSRVYRAGDAVLEAINVPHNGRNTGAGPMRILAVFMGAEGLATSLTVER